MKPSRLILSSLGLNALLVAVYMHGRAPLVKGIAERESVPTPESPTSDNSTGEKTNGSQEVPAAHAPFEWSQLHTDQWFTYRDDLRAIGCPDPTIRDILQPLVHQAFIDKRRTLTAPWIPRFWELVVPPKSTWVRLNQSLEALDGEDRRTLDQLMGGLAEEEGNSSLAGRLGDETASLLASLTPEHRLQVQEILAQQMDTQISISQQKNLSPEEQAKSMEDLEASTKQKIDEILSPEEAEQYHLRTSNYASLREIDSVDLTEEEIAQIIRLREQNGRSARADDESAALAEILGPERAKELQLAEDPNFQRLYEMTSGSENGAEKAKALFALQAQLEEMAQTIHAEPAARNATSVQELSAMEARQKDALQEWISGKAREILGEDDSVALWQHLQKDLLEGALSADSMAPWDEPDVPGP